MESSQIKLIQNFSDNVIEFENLDDFNNYYKINKADIDALSTNALNRKFKIKNHRICRKLGKIYLAPLKTPNVEQLQIGSDVLTIDEKLNRLNVRLKNIEEKINCLFEIFSELKNDGINPSNESRTQPLYGQPRFTTFGV